MACVLIVRNIASKNTTKIGIFLVLYKIKKKKITNKKYIPKIPIAWKTIGLIFKAQKAHLSELKRGYQRYLTC